MRLILYIASCEKAVALWAYSSCKLIVRFLSSTFKSWHRKLPAKEINVRVDSLKRNIGKIGTWMRSHTIFRRKPPQDNQKAKIAKVPFVFPYFFGFITALVLVSALVGAYMLIHGLPDPHILSARTIPVTTKIFDRNGILLYELYADQNRTPVSLAEIPLHFIHATVAIEDKDFYIHPGYSLRGIVRAAYATVLKHDVQGGSTITQQLVRSALLDREQTIQRKIKELILSIWAERLYSKDEILEQYVNQVPYGGLAWGAEAAAQTYFGKSIRDVTLAEAAFLAGLPAAPSTYSPHGAQPELAYERQKSVLQRMAEEGYITEQEKTQAQQEKLIIDRPKSTIKAPHFVMYVRDILAKKYGMRALEQGGLRVQTSLDVSLQEELEQIVADEVSALRHLNVGNGAVLVTNPQTGEILAMVGSTDYFNTEREGNVNVALSAQQPGSTIKVVTYSAALQRGYNAATLIHDSPETYNIAGSPPYSPVNYDGRFHGWITLREALGNSYNVPAVKTLNHIGVPAMIDQGQLMGISSWNDSSRYGLSLTLGGGEVTMLDMATVYGTLAAGGTRHDLDPILKVTDYRSVGLENNTTPSGVPVLPEPVAFILSDILADNRARTATFGPRSQLFIPGQWVASKTGTSNDKRDNWAIGFTKDFVVTVWVGNNDNSPMHPVLSSGITGATPIWRRVTDIMLTRYPSTESPQPPEGIVKAQCRSREEYFLKDTNINEACRFIPASPTPIQH